MSEIERIEPRAHQVEALEALRGALTSAERAQAHMCCGSGKTFLQAFLARFFWEEAEDPDSVIMACFVPNRALIYQNAKNFKKVFGDDVEQLGVCSETDLAGLVSEEDVTEGLATSTDVETISKFLKTRTRPRMIFSTYQSAPTFREALRQARGEKAVVTLGLLDEAHRTAGNKSTEDLFAYALSDDNFPMKKRAFFTATPRVLEGKKGKESQVISMSDKDVYGLVAYEYPFSRGIEDKNVVDYDLWVPIITHKELAEFMKEQGLEGEERAAVSMIALEKVMARTGQTRFLSYHNRISASKAFAKELQKLWSGKKTLVEHVDGKTPGKERDRLMGALSDGHTVLTNCKAFVEGVDAPGLQGVLFVDPRKSVVDVVQAVGRLSRPDPSDPGKRGSIIAPILTPSADPAVLARAAQVSGFDTLVQVAQALRANDDALEEDILERSRAMGRGDDTVEPFHNLKVLEPDDAPVDVDVLTQAITVATMTDLRDDFATWVGRLEAHINKVGHLPTRSSEPRLYNWMLNVRKKHMKGELEPVHAALLDDIEDWTWIGERTRADSVVAHIVAFKNRTQRMPSGRRGRPAEADLHAHLMEGQENYLRYGPGRGGALTDALEEANILFFAQEIEGKRAQQSGHFEVKTGEGGQALWFYPRADRHRKTVPVFASGHTTLPRPIRVHVGRLERERLMALNAPHSVRVTLVRAGIEKDPFLDGRILGWHAGTVDRGEKPDMSKASAAWLVNRLFDRKVSGREMYTHKNVLDKKIRLNKPATTLHQNAPYGTVEDVMTLVDRVRMGMVQDKMSDEVVRVFDTAPGFVWFEEGDTKEYVAAVVERLEQRWGEEIFSAKVPRLSDTGIGNTLRTLDAIVEREDPLAAALSSSVLERISMFLMVEEAD